MSGVILAGICSSLWTLGWYIVPSLLPFPLPCSMWRHVPAGPKGWFKVLSFHILSLGSWTESAESAALCLGLHRCEETDRGQCLSSDLGYVKVVILQPLCSLDVTLVSFSYMCVWGEGHKSCSESLQHESIVLRLCRIPKVSTRSILWRIGFPLSPFVASYQNQTNPNKTHPFI